eukprot:5364173-Pleurochrysis_carterae.AAC.1
MNSYTFSRIPVRQRQKSLQGAISCFKSLSCNMACYPPFFTVAMSHPYLRRNISTSVMLMPHQIIWLLGSGARTTPKWRGHF